MSIGMNRTTGRSIADDAEHIGQSIGDILTTPIDSRVKRRTYGSLIPDLIDQPSNPANKLRIMSASVMAIIRWENRVAIKAAIFSTSADGRSVIDLEATRRTGPRAGDALNLVVPLR